MCLINILGDKTTQRCKRLNEGDNSALLPSPLLWAGCGTVFNPIRSCLHAAPRHLTLVILFVSGIHNTIWIIYYFIKPSCAKLNFSGCILYFLF